MLDRLFIKWWDDFTKDFYTPHFREGSWHELERTVTRRNGALVLTAEKDSIKRKQTSWFAGNLSESLLSPKTKKASSILSVPIAFFAAIGSFKSLVTSRRYHASWN
jgi:hypothetical protein